METAQVIDYKREFWDQFKRFATFNIGDWQLLNRLPREDLATALNELVIELEEHIERNSPAKTPEQQGDIIVTGNTLYRARRILEQIRDGKEKLTKDFV